MKAAIPTLTTGSNDVDLFAQAVKQNLDGLTGQLKNKPKLKPLAATATLAEVIAQLNAILDRLQE